MRGAPGDQIERSVMSKCYEHLGLLTCDREKGHDGKHRDDWIMSVPVEFQSKEEPSERESDA